MISTHAVLLNAQGVFMASEPYVYCVGFFNVLECTLHYMYVIAVFAIFDVPC